jgi:putative transposase
MVSSPRQWPWSSYRAMLGQAAVPPWLAVDGLLSLFAERRTEARERYGRFVAEGVGKDSIWRELRQQIYLGDDAFVERMQAQLSAVDEMAVPKAQRRAPAPPLPVIAECAASRARGYRGGACHWALQLPGNRGTLSACTW